MKEASGELSMTAIAVVAIAAVGTVFVTFVWPSLKGAMVAKTNCQSAYNCGACTNNTKTCTGYYDENGKTKSGNLQCDC